MKLSENILTEREMRRALAAHDAGYDGVFFFAVRTTGIFCRPSCVSKPKPENIEFFPTVREAVGAGYRPCKRCQPLQVNGAPPTWIGRIIARVQAEPATPVKSADLRALGVTPERVRRWFVQNYGMTFTAWCRGLRLADAFTQIRSGEKLDEVVFATGFESHSGFREAFGRTFQKPPGQSRLSGERILTAMLESPLGPLVAATTDDGICLLEFTDRRMLEHNYATMRRRFGCAVVPGKHKFLDQLQEELARYFAGERKQFTVPVEIRGTPFQEKVWTQLCRIPPGETISYEELAQRIGQPTAQRAVARANGMNRICILIPCHRVIAKDGTLSGYGGGVWRKRLLLELESGKKTPVKALVQPNLL